MTLAPGTRLGSYVIEAAIGAGGMGEVYRARDPRLGRDVAVKVLPEAVASDPERLARFEREARTLAALNHPHIAHVYGFEQSGATVALVMELVEGEDLAQQIARGALRLDEALPIAQQIADALEAAHEAGIIHRDLKPSNIKVRPDGTVKVLDFGLAKAMDPVGQGFSPGVAGAAASDPANSPTITSPARLRQGFGAAGTEMGVILGTAAYMAPEQAKGRPLDKRADIWAFGCVLFEMLTGRRPFEGDTVSEVLAKVLERDPDWARLPAALPPGLVRLVRRCLEKDPKRRFHDIADVRIELEEIQSGPPAWAVVHSAPRRPRRLLAWAIPAALTVAAVVVLVRDLGRAPRSAQQPAHLQIDLPAGVLLAVDTEHPVLALSPDGTVLVFVGDENGTRRLYLRRLAEREARPIPGTDGAASPFFSPDGEWIGYYSGYGLAKVAVGGGVPVPILVMVRVPVAQGATWVSNGAVVVANSVNSGLSYAPISGDRRQPITAIKPMTRVDLPYAWPSALPDGRHVLFADNTGDRPRAAVLNLNDRRVTPLINGATNPRYSASGHVLFARDGAVYAAPFDLQHAAITGAEQKLLDGVMSQPNGAAQFSVAANGVLAYVAGTQLARQQDLVWVDRQGRAELLSDAREVFLGPRFSPDGRQLALASVEGPNIDIWRLDVARGALTRVTTHPGEDFSPVWSPDGKTLALASEIGEDAGERGPVLARIVGYGRPEQLVRSPAYGDWDFPSSWSPDGKWIAYTRVRGGASWDVMLFPARGAGEPIAFLESPANEYAAMFSPDGRWVAFVSDESKRPEVYVTPFPGPGERIQISTAGGIEPLWARTRQALELFYRQGNKLMAVAFRGGSMESASAPRALFEGRYESNGNLGAETANYDVAPDGRFVMVRRKNPVTPRVIHVVLNWPKALGARDAGTAR